MNCVRNKIGLAKTVLPHWTNNCLFAIGFTLSTLVAAYPVAAQENRFVRIEVPDSDLAVQGELISFDDDFYYVEGPIGTYSITRTDVICLGIACPDVANNIAVENTSRQVVLESIDGETRLSGELMNVDGQFYVINNILGEFRIAKSGVECIGPACPEIIVYDPKFAIHASTPEIGHMIAGLLNGYADANSQRIEIDADGNLPSAIRLFSQNENELVADIDLIIEGSQDAVQVLSGQAPDIVFQAALEFAGQQEINDAPNVEKILIAFDGLVVIGHPDNPVRSLSFDEIARISNGSINSWRPLGGGNFPMTLHLVDASSPTSNDARLWLANYGASATTGVVTHTAEADVIAAVQADRNAIGVVHRAPAVIGNAKMLDLRRVCGLTASPSNFDIQVEQYPLSQPVYAYANGAATHPVALSFLDWSQSGDAMPNISGAGFVGTQLQRMKLQDMGVAVIHTAAVEADFDGQQFASMMQELRNADRLSITFRFLPGSASLDDVSIQNVKDLAERLRQSEFDGQEVMLVGFADSVGPANRNTVLSARRAEVVRDLLAVELDQETRARLDIRAISYGEQMPLDCNDTDNGRANNRRVEVWAKVAN